MTGVKYMQHAELMAWRKQMRGELLARRAAMSADQLHAWRLAIDRHSQRVPGPGPGRGGVLLADNEYDARHLRGGCANRRGDGGCR